MKYILVIGGTGFLGSYLVRHLAQKNSVQFTYANTNSALGLRYQVGKDLLKDVINEQYDIVINNVNPINLSYQQTLLGIEEVVQLCEKHKSFLIHISSVSALYENRFANSYNLKKAIVEDFLKTEMKHDSYSVLRFTQLFDAEGLSNKSQSGLYYLLNEIKNNRLITLFSNYNECRRNYMPVEIALKMIEVAVEKRIDGFLNAHLDKFTFSFDQLIEKICSLNKNFNSKEMIVIGDRKGLSYYIGEECKELVEEIDEKENIMNYFHKVYSQIV